MPVGTAGGELSAQSRETNPGRVKMRTAAGGFSLVTQLAALT